MLNYIMKPGLLLVFHLVISWTFLNAQNTLENPDKSQNKSISFGIKAGWNSGFNSNYSIQWDEGTDYENIIHKSNFHFGIFADFHTSKHFSFETNLLLVTRSFEILSKSVPYTRTGIAQADLNYLDIPILFKYNFNIKKVKFYLGMGTYLSLPTGGLIKFEIYDSGKLYYSRVKNWNNSNDRFRDLDLGFATLMGIEIKKYKLDFSYRYGLVHQKFAENETNYIYVSLGYILSEPRNVKPLIDNP